jgi:hypothetical protein
MDGRGCCCLLLLLILLLLLCVLLLLTALLESVLDYAFAEGRRCSWPAAAAADQGRRQGRRR